MNELDEKIIVVYAPIDPEKGAAGCCGGHCANGTYCVAGDSLPLP